MHRNTALRISMLAVPLMLGACGAGGSPAPSAPAAVPREIRVEMVDLDFRPETFTVRKGETVRFTFTNAGQAVHEAVIGTEQEQQEHEQEMASGSASGMGGHAMGSGAMAAEVEVAPGASGALEYTFSEPGELLMGCHQPGHYPAGMIARIKVTG